MSTFISYVNKQFRKGTLDTIHAANMIIEDYQRQGFSLTLRQLYYQFVSKGLIPNSDASYNRLKGTISDGRLAGLISWDAIEDRSRTLRGYNYLSSPAQAVALARDGYRRDLWADQPWHPEVWVEKEALVDVVGSICGKLRVDFFACKGYNSQSEQWRAGQRFAQAIRRGQRPIVFHLGDHDPSGIDMTRDNRDRLSMFAGTPISVQRLALNWDQIEELKPPPNPAKLTDSRVGDYIERYGESSWELDALPPQYITKLIRDAVDLIKDHGRWDESLLRELDDQQELDMIVEELSNDD